jgi:branched-chain amino acid transport system substrate-binding protein
MKRKSIWLVTLLLILALMLAACGGGGTETDQEQAPVATEAPAETGSEEEAVEPEAEPTEEPVAEEPAAEAEGEPIVIGASLPLSGRFSEPGTAAQQGYEVWAEIVNESGGLLGRPVELIVVDNASDQDTAVADYEKLITVDEVDLVVGPFSSFLVIPTSEVAARYGYAFVEPAGGAPDVFNRGLTNIFFAQPAPGDAQAIPFVDYVLALPDDQRPASFAVVSQDDPFTLGVMDGIKASLTEAGIELVFDEIYAPETTDFSAIAIQVADLDPDLIVGGTVLEDSIGQIRAYEEAGYEPRGAFFTTGPSLPGPFREALGNATEGVFAAISWFPAATDFQNAEMVAKYIEMFGGDAGDIPEDVANAFTVGQVLQQAAENIQSIDNEALIEELHQGTYDTVVGPLSFDEVGQPQGSFMLLQWQGDTFSIVGPPERAQTEAMWPKPVWSEGALGEPVAVEAAAPSGEPIVIGASLPLSGRFSEPGTAAQQGYEVWADMVNSSGGLLGRPVELVIVDNASDQDTAVADYEKLITVDEVDLVVGPFSSFLVIPT